MRDLMERDPVAAAALLLTPDTVQNLAASYPDAADLLETRGEWTGRLERWVVDDFASRSSRTVYRLDAGPDKAVVFFSTPAPDFAFGQAVRVAGAKFGDAVLVTAPAMLAARSLAAPGYPTMCPSEGDQKAAIILINEPTLKLPPTVTPEAVRDVFFGPGVTVDQYWRASSFGKVSISGSVFGPFTLDKDYPCATDAFDILVPAIQAAGAQVDSTFTHAIVVMPDNKCPFGGVAGGCNILLPQWGGPQPTTSFSVGAHEVGHTIGVHHAETLDFGFEALGPPAATGVTQTYGDPFNVMAAYQGYGHPAAPHKARVGWLDAGTEVVVVESAGTYVLAPYAQATKGGIRALKVRRGRGGDGWLWLEYRQPSDRFEATLYNLDAGVFSGALIHYEGPGLSNGGPKSGWMNNGGDTYLLDFTPVASPNNFADAALQAGSSWADPYSDLSIRIGKATSSGLEVAVAYGSPRQCEFAVDPMMAEAGSGGGRGQLAITAGDGCRWSAESKTPWIVIDSAFSGEGPSVVSYRTLPNTATARRSGLVQIAGKTVAISQAPALVKLNAGSASVPATGGSGTVAVASVSGAASWTAASNVSWLSSVVARDGGGGTVRFTAEPNSGPATRTATLTIGGSPFTVVQPPADAPVSAFAVKTVAGPGAIGDRVSNAWFRSPSALAIDDFGNIYIADPDSSVVRKIRPDGSVITVAGTGSAGFSGDGGPAISAQLNHPAGVAVDSSGLYIADQWNNRIRKVSAASGTISTIAGWEWWYPNVTENVQATQTTLHSPKRVALDGRGNLYVVETDYHRVRVISSSGIIRTFAGAGAAGFTGDGGPASAAALKSPEGVLADAAGSVYICDSGNSRVRRVSKDGVIATVAGSGAYTGVLDGVRALDSQLDWPRDLVSDSAGNLLIATETGILRLNPDGTISVVASYYGGAWTSVDAGQAPAVGVRSTTAIVVDKAGNLYYADRSAKIRKIDAQGAVNVVAGTDDVANGGPAVQARLFQPGGLAFDAQGNTFFADSQNSQVRRISPAGNIDAIAGARKSFDSEDGVDARVAALSDPRGLVVDAAGNVLVTSAQRVRSVSKAGRVATVAGTAEWGSSGDGGPATAAKFSYITGLALDGSGNLYVADTGDNRIRKVAPDGSVSAFAGNGSYGSGGDGGLATSASVNPAGIAALPDGSLVISDTSAGAIRRVGRDGRISTLKSNFWSNAIGADAAGYIYAGTYGKIVRISPAGAETTIAGNGAAGFAVEDGPADQAMFSTYIGGIAVDMDGNVVLSDGNNHRVRAIRPGQPSCAFASSSTYASFGPSGGSGSFDIRASSPGCPWAVRLDNTWIAVKKSQGSGNATVEYTVAANPGAGSRIGVITVGGATHAVEVAGIASGPQISAVLNAATLLAGPIAPNEFIAIRGIGLSSAAGYNGAMTTLAAGTRLYVSGIAAPITYASPTQVNALVPFGIPAGGTVEIQAEYNGMRGNVAVAAVDAASPGIFTQQYGPGQAWVLNQDGTFNSDANPAQRLGVIAFWATGQGLVDSTLQDGVQPGAPFPNPVAPLSVAIGGIKVPDTDVKFKGLIYSGEIQVNVVVPGAAPVGPAVPIVLTVGGASSRADATLAIR